MKSFNCFDVGDVIETYDNSLGMIVEIFDAASHLSLSESSMGNPLFQSFKEIVMYKVLIHGTICYINETNIKGIFRWGKEKKNL